MTNFFNVVPTWLLMVVALISVLGVSELGYRFGLRHVKDEFDDAPSALVQAAAFTLLALLLGFSFSLSLNRYDARRTAFRDEVNAIRRTYMRASLLDAPSAAAMQADLRKYVDVRLDFARADADPARRAADTQASLALRESMWAAGVRAAHRDPRSTTIPLFLTSLNDTVDAATSEAAILSAHIPDIVMLILMIIALVVGAMMGFNFARKGQHAFVPKLLYAILFALTLGLVFDIDRPQRGIVRVNLDPMFTLQQEMVNSRGY